MVLNIPKEASHDMLQQTRSLGLDQLGNHVTKDGSDSIESLVGGADVVKAVVIE